MRSVFAKKVWTSRGWINHARVDIDNGVIVRVVEDASEGKVCVPVLIPGMIELHVHGSLGYNASFGDACENAVWLRRLASHGVTGVLPTLSSSPAQKICRAVAFYDDVRRQPIANAARVFGVHLEGPFLNAEKKGGIDGRYLHAPSVAHFQSLCGAHEEAVKLITVAPELEGSQELIRYLRDRGICVNAGHSNATAEQMREAIACGLDGVTHFFNAARPMTHRDPGFLTAALLNPNVYCEMVSDLVHVAPEVLCLLVRTAGPRRMAVVTDAVTLTGMPDGRYGDRVVVEGSPRLENGTLTGGRYLMDDCARALIGIGLDPWDVFCMTSHTPSRRIGLTNVGDIAQGLDADLVAMDEQYQVLFTMIGGEEVFAASPMTRNTIKQ